MTHGAERAVSGGPECTSDGCGRSPAAFAFDRDRSPGGPALGAAAAGTLLQRSSLKQSANTSVRAMALLHTQQTRGNRAAQRTLRPIQTKLTISQPGDQFEQEADRVARQVTDGKSCACGGTCDECAKSSGAGRPVLRSGPMVQRVCRDHSDESFYSSAPNYCKDTGFSGSLHPGQRCYREVPRRTGYFQCPPGDQVCFDAQGGCHDSYDKASPVESKESDGTCNLHGLCTGVAHTLLDVIPGIFEEGARAQADELVDCLASCDSLEGFGKEMCRTECHRSSRLIP